MAKHQTYYMALKAERDTLLAKHGFVRVGSEDGYQWESPVLVTRGVYQRLGKLERLMTVALGKSPLHWLEYALMYQSRARGDSIRTINKWFSK